MAQHASLAPERWARFSLDQQILMIANEMNRAAKLIEPLDAERLRRGYERTLQLADLTIGINARQGLRRELLRWRDLIAVLYASQAPTSLEHEAAFRCLLRMTPAASKQIPFVLGNCGSRE
jgi:hypothetical protein